MSIEIQIKKLNELIPIESSAKKAKAKIILEFIENGGYLAYGYSSFKSFYKDHGDQLHYGRSYYYQLIEGVNTELILGIPIGTYTVAELKGIKGDIFSNPSYNKVTNQIMSGHSLIINKKGRNPIEEFREKWREIQSYTGKDLPSGKEIKHALADLFGKVYAERKDVASYYTSKVQLLEKTIKVLQDKCDRLTQENQELKRKLNHQSRKLSSRSLLAR